MLLTNVWNFMDGIDGLATSQAAIVALALALVLGGAWMLLAMGLVAAAAGFLPFNFPKARIFLGDVGSGALGFLLAGLLSIAMFHTPTVWPLLWLPLAAFLVDALFTLAMRILRGEKWWAPHVQHTYQQWASRDGGHVKVTLAYAAFSLVGLLLMQLGLVWVQAGAAWICWVWYLAAMLLWARMRRDVYINKDARQ
jgi:UDP-N-acetylmuramyl pentapeptide phosphotransferase/UDP-N-acetylglucosamine-1-phosphate transferase